MTPLMLDEQLLSLAFYRSSFAKMLGTARITAQRA